MYGNPLLLAGEDRFAGGESGEGLGRGALLNNQMNEHNPHISSIGDYLAIFMALRVLTALTVWVAF